MRKKVLIALLVLFCLGVLIVGTALGYVVYQERRAGDELTESDVIIVLGARVKPDGVLSNSLQYRLEKAMEVYEAGYARRFIVCGAKGSDEPVDEATAMREYLLERGVPAEDVFTDPVSVNTRQNLINALAIMQEQDMHSAIIVTNAYHVARAKALASDLGIEALGASAKMPRGLRIPWKMRLREALSWINYLLRYRKR